MKERSENVVDINGQGEYYDRYLGAIYGDYIHFESWVDYDLGHNRCYKIGVL